MDAYKITILDWLFCILFQHLFYLSYNKSMNWFLPMLLLYGVRFCKQMCQLTIHCSNQHANLFPDPELILQCCCLKKYSWLWNMYKLFESQGVFQICMYTAPYLHVYIASGVSLFIYSESSLTMTNAEDTKLNWFSHIRWFLYIFQVW